MTRKQVTERALVQRLNRCLAREDRVLRKCRPGPDYAELGDWYCVDLSSNTIASKDVDLEEWGRELGVLKPYEAMSDG